MAEPEPEYVRARLRYDPESGKLFWLPHPKGRPAWDAKYAGTEAFTALDSKGYRFGSIDNRSCRAHRVIWVLLKGVWPESDVDHIDGDRQNNRASNLRSVSRRANSMNRGLQSNNTSGEVGVSWHTRSRRWRAVVVLHGRPKELGRFLSLEEAVRARDEAHEKHGFHPNHGRR